MPNPTPGQVHVDQLLTDLSVAYLQSSTKYVADRVFPRVPVANRSNKYAVYSQADFLRSEVQKRQAGSQPARVGYNTDNTNTYSADEYAVEHIIDDQVRANANGPYMPEEDAVKFLTQKMLLAREVDFVTKFFSTAIWSGSTKTSGDMEGGTDFTKWSNAASTPIENLHKGMQVIESKNGFLPNKLVVNRKVWFDLKNHPDIVDRVKYTSRDAVSTDIVARLLGLDEILIAAAAKNSAAEEVAASNTYVAGANALLVYAAPSPGLMQPSGGYTFVWTGLIGSNEGQVVETYRDDRVVSDVVRMRAAWDQRVIAAPLGVLYHTASTN